MNGGNFKEAGMSKETERVKSVVTTKVNLAGNAAAGTVAGFTSSVVTHPLDVVKTRFQVHDGRVSTIPKYRSTLHALVTISRSEGFRTLYAGFSPNLVGSAVAWGSYFYGYNYLKELARSDKRFMDSHGELGPLTNMTCAMLAGMSTCLVTNPIWLVKTRLQLQHDIPIEQRQSMTGMLSQVFRNEGIVGLYRGLLPSMLLTLHGALQFMAYEEIKKLVTKHLNHGDEHLSTIQTLGTALTSKVFASLITYPSQVVRSRLQQSDPVAAQSGGGRYWAGPWDVVVKTLRHEGMRGFYKGLSPNLMRVIPSSGITFVVYENVARLLGTKT